jgi:capsular exopolysaccharide synthesis family protein
MLDGLRKAPGAIPELDLAALIGVPDQQPEQPIETRTRPVESEAMPSAVVAGTAARDAAPLPGRIISLRLPQNSPALPFDGKQWQANEQYRIVRTKLVQHLKRPKMILISSTGPGDGKSITAINLAGAMALKSEAKVLLLDCDFRRSAIHTHLGTPETPGIAEVLAGKCNLEDAIVVAEEMPNLWILPAGRSERNPVELLDSSRWVQTVSRLRALFKYIIVDSPPFAAVADYDLLQSASDGVVMVIRPDQSNRELCYKALETVPKDKLIGVVMNCVPKFFAGRQCGYGYGYGYY